MKIEISTIIVAIGVSFLLTPEAWCEDESNPCAGLSSQACEKLDVKIRHCNRSAKYSVEGTPGESGTNAYRRCMGLPGATANKNR